MLIYVTRFKILHIKVIAMSRNNCLNILKCIACIGVVFIHIAFPGIFGRVIQVFAAFAVPLFLMIAGYYSYGCNKDKIKKRFIKIIKILLLAILLYFTYSVVKGIYNHSLSTWLIDNFTWMSPIRFFVFCTIDWAIPLWYLIAMAETYFVWIFIVKYKWQHKATKFTWIFFLLSLVLTIIVESMDLNWSYQINFILRALPWFMFGYLVKEKYEVKLDKVNNLTLFGVAILGWCIALSAILLKCKIEYQYLGILIASPALFLIGVKNPDVKISKTVEYIGDKLSLFIYILHPLVSTAVSFTVMLIGINKEGIYSYFHPILTLIATIIVATLFELIFRNRKLSKYIY